MYVLSHMHDGSLRMPTLKVICTLSGWGPGGGGEGGVVTLSKLFILPPF